MSTYMKNAEDGNDATVAQLASSHPAALGVFEKFNIDYCCGGHLTLEEACRKIGLNPIEIRQEIEQSMDDVSQVLRTEKWF